MNFYVTLFLSVAGVLIAYTIAEKMEHKRIPPVEWGRRGVILLVLLVLALNDLGILSLW